MASSSGQCPYSKGDLRMFEQGPHRTPQAHACGDRSLGTGTLEGGASVGFPVRSPLRSAQTWPAWSPGFVRPRAVAGEADFASTSAWKRPLERVTARQTRALALSSVQLGESDAQEHGKPEAPLTGPSRLAGRHWWNWRPMGWRPSLEAAAEPGPPHSSAGLPLQASKV